MSRKPHPKAVLETGKRLFVPVALIFVISIPFHLAAAQGSIEELPESTSISQYSHYPKHENDPGGERVENWKTVPKDFLHDQKKIWTFPVHLAHGEHLAPTLAISTVTAGLIVADPHAMPYFGRHQTNLDDLNDVFDSSITSAEVFALPAALLASGYLRHDEYQKGTALLAGVAYADSAVVDLAMKAITRRKRPSDVVPTGSYNDTFFAGGKSPFKGSSFPSGHAAGVFSVATVIASRYHNHRWVPWVAYGFATAISFSRVTTLSHFPSDVFLGAALGYTVTRYGTLGPR